MADAVDLTPAQEAIVEVLAAAAVGATDDVMDAAELLVVAAGAILMRNYAPKVAIDLLTSLIEAVQEGFRMHVQ